MNLRQLPFSELHKAHEAADYLLGLHVDMNHELSIKLDTFRADLTAEIEDRELAELAVCQPAEAATE